MLSQGTHNRIGREEISGKNTAATTNKHNRHILYHITQRCAGVSETVREV